MIRGRLRPNPIDYNAPAFMVYTESENKELVPQKQDVDSQFLEFWNSYNYKTNMGKGQKAWSILEIYERDAIIKMVPIYLNEISQAKAIKVTPPVFLRTVWRTLLQFPQYKDIRSSVAGSFEEFWILFDNKHNYKDSSRLKWNTLKKEEKEVIIKSIPVYKQHLKETGAKPIHPRTYLFGKYSTFVEGGKFYGESNSFEEFWDVYDTKVGQSKSSALANFLKKDYSELGELIKYIPVYEESLKSGIRPGKKMTPCAYLNSHIWKNDNLYSFEEFWSTYNFRTLSDAKLAVMAKFNDLDGKERKKIFDFLPEYLRQFEDKKNTAVKMLPSEFIISRIWDNQH